MTKVVSTITDTTNEKTPFGRGFDDLCKNVITLGFDAVIYSFYPKTFHQSPSTQPILQYSNRFAPFVKHYIDNDYGNRDFVIRLAFKGKTESIDWWEEIDNGHVRPDELEVTLDGRDNFGIQNGITIPIVKGPYAIAGISAISFNPDKAYFKNIKSAYIESLIDLAKDYHFSIISANENLFQFVEQIIEHWDDRKRHVLRQLLRNQPMKMISVWHPELNVKNAEKILRTIKQELGGISTNQLMYLLGKMNAEKYLLLGSKDRIN